MHRIQLNDIRLQKKLIGAFFLAGIVPVLLVTLVVSITTRNVMVKAAFSKLKAVQTIKQNQLQQFFQDKISDVEVYAANTMVITAVEFFGVAIEEEGGFSGELWQEWNRELGVKFESFAASRGYDDLYLISSEGRVVYSVKKGQDVGVDLVSGAGGSTVLARAFQQAIESEKPYFADFEWYDLQKRPCAFIASPIQDEFGYLTGVLVFEISVASINRLMQERSGMGETGETIVVGRDGRLRSDSFLGSYTVMASFNPDAGMRIETKAAARALAGEDNQDLIRDMSGKTVFSCFAPVALPSDTRWAILAEVGQNEIMKPIRLMVMKIGFTGLAISLLMALFGFWLAGEIARPLSRVVLMIKDIAQGEADLTRRIGLRSNDETGELALWFDRFIEQLHHIILQVQDMTGKVVDAANEMGSSSEELALGAGEQKKQTEAAVNSIQEIREAISRNSEGAQQTSVISESANRKAVSGMEAMASTQSGMDKIVQSASKTRDLIEQLDHQISDIAEVLHIITDVTDQTEILSVNATIEAARVGEHGYGFAVVANEIRKLSDKTAQQTESISDTIMNIQKSIKDVKGSMDEMSTVVESGQNATRITYQILNEITDSIHQTQSMTELISSASEEQSATVVQITENIEYIQSISQETFQSAEQVAETAQKLALQTENLNQLIKKFKLDGRS